MTRFLSGPVQNNFAGFTRFHGFKALFELIYGQSVGNDAADIQPVLGEFLSSLRVAVIS
jgi:hypothetical protein